MRILVWSVALTALLALGSGLPGRAIAADLIPVTIGNIPSLTGAPLYIAKDKGYYEALGLDVQLTNSGSPADQAALLTTNRLQLVGGAVTAGFFNAFARKLPVELVLSRAVSPINHYLMARVALRGVLKKPADLKGHTIGTDVEWRTRYLGPGWDLAKVRGTRFNTGDGLRLALDAGAMPFGQWSGCHAASWARHAPLVGDVAIDEKFKRDDFMHGIFINADGLRFVDEGADLRALTYAKYGRVVMAQPGSVAWQVFDAKTTPLLSDDYRDPSVAPIRADTLDDLARNMTGCAPKAFLRTVAEFNAAVRDDMPHDPSRKDGRGTRGLAIPKSNWATAIDRAPFEAHPVSFGITFTFGGVRVDERARMLDIESAPIPGLYAAGEMIGGLFYFNYPGGAGLVSAAVFGRLAGRTAAMESRSVQ